MNTAHPYDRHVGRYGAELARGLIGCAGIGAGDSVLDVGCGTGQLTVALAALVGPDRVAALDPSPAVFAVCRARVPGADIRVGSAEELPYADGEFDAVLAQLVVNLVNDPPGAVREMARVTRPRGAVAACFWDDERMPLLRSFWDAVDAVAPDALTDVAGEARVGLADPERARTWWLEAGLGEVELGDFDVSAAYESFDDLFFSFEQGVGHSGAIFTALAADQQARVREEVHRRVGSPEGAFRLTAGVRTVRGVR